MNLKTLVCFLSLSKVFSNPVGNGLLKLAEKATADILGAVNTPNSKVLKLYSYFIIF